MENFAGKRKNFKRIESTSKKIDYLRNILSTDDPRFDDDEKAKFAADLAGNLKKRKLLLRVLEDKWPEKPGLHPKPDPLNHVLAQMEWR